jgi:hypothetical protein
LQEGSAQTANRTDSTAKKLAVAENWTAAARDATQQRSNPTTATPEGPERQLRAFVFGAAGATIVARASDGRHFSAITGAPCPREPER